MGAGWVLGADGCFFDGMGRDENGFASSLSPPGRRMSEGRCCATALYYSIDSGRCRLKSTCAALHPPAS